MATPGRRTMIQQFIAEFWEAFQEMNYMHLVLELYFVFLTFLFMATKLYHEEIEPRYKFSNAFLFSIFGVHLIISLILHWRDVITIYVRNNYYLELANFNLSLITFGISVYLGIWFSNEEIKNDPLLIIDTVLAAFYVALFNAFLCPGFDCGLPEAIIALGMNFAWYLRLTPKPLDFDCRPVYQRQWFWVIFLFGFLGVRTFKTIRRYWELQNELGRDGRQNQGRGVPLDMDIEMAVV